MHYIAAALLTALPALAMGAAHDVTVGANGALAYSPTEVTAAMGDTVNFHFMPGDHSVAQSTFDAPCAPSGGDGIYSGFISPSTGVDSMMFSILINSTDPIWIYCSQVGHCSSGMSMVINAPSGMTLAAYQKAAKTAKTASSPSGISGGIIVPNKNGFVQGGSSSGSSSSAAVSSSAAATSSKAAASSSMAAASSSMAVATPSMSAMHTSAAPAMSSAMSSAAAAASSSSIYPGAAAATRVPAAAVAAAGGLLAWAMI